MDSDIENGRNRVCNFAMDTPDPKYLLEKLDVVFDSLKCADKLSVAIGFVLKNVEDGSFRCYIARENITLLEKSKFVATTEEMTEIRKLQKIPTSLNRVQENDPTQNKKKFTSC